MSRRSALRASLAAGAAALIPGLACGVDDESVFAGATAEPTTTLPPTTRPPTTRPTTTEPTTTQASDLAVDGELVVGFTYTQGAGGKNERPYVAVWLEDPAGELVATIALWYELGRRGDRWLDHLTRWYDLDLDRTLDGTPSDAATVSSATRAPGAYSVVWDGTVGAEPAPAGDYVLCIEAVREEGPHSLICEPVSLTGSLSSLSLPDDGELSAVSVRIDV